MNTERQLRVRSAKFHNGLFVSFNSKGRKGGLGIGATWMKTGETLELLWNLLENTTSTRIVFPQEALDPAIHSPLLPCEGCHTCSSKTQTGSQCRLEVPWVRGVAQEQHERMGSSVLTLMRVSCVWVPRALVRMYRLSSDFHRLFPSSLPKHVLPWWPSAVFSC